MLEALKLCTYVVTLDTEHRDPEAKRVYLCGEELLWEKELPHLLELDQFELFYCQTDRPFTRIMFQAIRPRVKHVYAVNCDFSHPMVTRLPLGLPPTLLPRRSEFKRDILCYLNLGEYLDEFVVHRSARVLRQHCKTHFEKYDWVLQESKVPQMKFYDRLMHSRFVICPYGVGIDTWRFYEAAWYGAIPIVLSSNLDEVHAKFGAAIVDDWSEVTEERLRRWTGCINYDAFNMSEYLK